MKLLRYEEDWSSFCDSSLKLEALDRIKCIPAGKLSLTAYLSIGGEFRGVFEHVQNDTWSPLPDPTNTFGLERYQLHADLYFNKHARLFLQLESGQEQERLGGPRPIDQKNLDFLNAFLDLSSSPSTLQTRFRIGRQELQFGSGRLVAVREGPNVRQGFYGGRVTQRLNAWTIDGFAARPAKDNPAFFDNVPVQTTSFWGVFAERTFGGVPARSFDFYDFGLDRKAATFNQGTKREQRQTVGGRIASAAPPASDRRSFIPHYDVESVYQFRLIWKRFDPSMDDRHGTRSYPGQVAQQAARWDPCGYCVWGQR